ncbi:MAG: DoxX family protein [Dehalococcoidia bacterium]
MAFARLGQGVELADPPLYRMIFANTVMAPAWLIVRLYVGWQWISSGWHKVHGEGNWLENDGVRGFWERIVEVPDQGRPAIKYDWYRDFVQFLLDREWSGFFSWLIALGEMGAGIALIIGLLTGFAALGGAFMNMNFMLAGSASSNPVLFLLAILLMLAWKVAGHIGIDRWLLPMLGTPWSAGLAWRDPVTTAPAEGAALSGT